MNVEPLFRSLDPRAPSQTRLDEITEQALDAEQPGLLLHAASPVNLQQSDGVPLLALVACRTDARIPLTSRGVLVVTRRQDNLTLADTWSPWKEPSGRRVSTSDRGKHGFSVQAPRADLRARIPTLTWRPGHLLVRAIVNDRVTAPCEITLDGGPLEADPDVRAYLDWMASQQPLPPLPPRSPVAVDYHPDAQTPEVPSHPGIALDLQKVSLTTPGHALTLRGSFNLPVQPHERIPVTSPEHRDAEGRAVVARVTITLVVVGHDSPGPAVIPLHLDARAFTIEGRDGPTHAAGVFRLDLLAHPDMPRILQRYSVYAFAYEHMVGPLPLTLLGEQLVPTR